MSWNQREVDILERDMKEIKLRLTAIEERHRKANLGWHETETPEAGEVEGEGCQGCGAPGRGGSSDLCEQCEKQYAEEAGEEMARLRSELEEARGLLERVKNALRYGPQSVIEPRSRIDADIKAYLTRTKPEGADK